MSLWKDHFHWKILLGWEVLAWILGTLLTVGGLMLFFDQYVGANMCFIFTSILILAKIGQLAIASHDASWTRMIFTFVLFGFFGVAIIETVRGVNNWARTKRVQIEQPTKDQPSVLPTEKSNIPKTQTTRVQETSKGKPSPPAKEPPAAPKPTPPSQAIQMDVGLRFIYPNKPALVILNLSDSVVRNIKWTVLLWNMDLPDRNDPLPIPVGVYDFIRAKSEGGPQNLFDTPLVAPLLKPGDRLFGSASIDCPDCDRGRTYVVYIVFGKEGWFSEVISEKSGGSYRPKSFDKAGRDEYFKALDAGVAAEYRTPIPEN